MTEPKTPRASWLDKTISFINPEAGLKRKYYKDQLEFAYDAANLGRAAATLGGTASLAAPESLANQRDRIKMMWEARNLVNNYSFFKSILLKEAMYVCGQIRYQSQTGNPDIDRQIESYFSEWSKRCDVTGRYPFRHLVQLAHMGMRRDGDAGFALVTQGKDVFLQAIEADRLGNPHEGGKNDDTYIGGITIDNLGRPHQYRIFKRTLHGQYTNPRDVPKSNFIHYIDPLRADQYRGITAFETAIPHAKDLYELLQMEKLAVKWASAHAGVITKDDHGKDKWSSTPAAAPPQPGDPLQKGNHLNLEAVHAGKLIRLRPGESMEAFSTSSRPSATFNGFITTLVREMANGLNLPFAFVWDMSAFGGATARLEVQAAQRAFMRHQQLLQEQVLDPVKNIVISRAIAFGDLPPNANYRKGRWQFNSQITADLGHETQANLSLLEAGLKTRGTIIGESGRDFEEEIEKIAKEIAYMEEMSRKYKIPLALIAKTLEGGSKAIVDYREALASEAEGQEPSDHDAEIAAKQTMAQTAAQLQAQNQFAPAQPE